MIELKSQFNQSIQIGADLGGRFSQPVPGSPRPASAAQIGGFARNHLEK
jgi:hypothetical protein